MRRGLMLSVSLGLFALIAGCCHRCHGVCDCPVQPLEHGTPAPYVKPALPPGESIHPIPAPAANTPAPPIAQ